MPAAKRHSSIPGNKWFILLLFIVAAGCKKVTEEQGLVGICPLVVATDPANAAGDVTTNKTITAVFNETMDPSTITTTSFTVKNGTVTIPGVVSYSGLTATFSPTADLASNTT